MFFQQIYEPGLAHASYMVGCQATGEVMVIDAKRDVDTYVEIAKRERLRITHVTETHIHADFLCGSRELAALTGAQILLSDEGGPGWQYAYPHTGLTDGSSFMVGNIRVDVMHTPGHTPEHISFLVTDTPTSATVPIMMFTGDFVFVGDVGRPDLLEKAAGIAGTSAEGAKQMWASLQRFRALPDHIQVHPAHGAGSACGKALGAIPSTTVGYEKLVNWALQHTTEEAFTAELLSGQPEPPTYFAAMKQMNKEERLLAPDGAPIPEPLSAQELCDAITNGSQLVDTRSRVMFAQAHIPGSLNIQDNKAFSTWAGWVLDYIRPVVLVCTADRFDELRRRLQRIGVDNVQGFVPSIEPWLSLGGVTEGVATITTDELYGHLHDDSYMILDVRAANEYAAGHIPNALNIHAGHLLRRLREVPQTGTLVVSCQAGDRSSIASSLLQAAGYKNVVAYPPGYAGWVAAKQPVEKIT